MQKGFSLLELILTIAILTIVVFVASSIWLGYRTQTNLDATARTITDTLRRAQDNAISGENFTTWGVRFDNISTAFYQLFSGSTWGSGTKYEYFALPQDVVFSSPASGTSSEILFNQRIGKNSVGVSSVIIQSSTNPTLKRTVTVSADGRISID